jgi:ketosteroid isomerase-like protein
MSNSSDIERRIRILEDIEAIKNLKARYWRSVDLQQWENLADCYTEDVVFDDAHFGRMEGRSYIVKVLKRAMRNIKTIHQGHNPEIEVLDDTTARGRWTLNDRVETPDGVVMAGYGIYEDDYVKLGDSWKIRSSKLTYIFQENFPART